MIVQHNIEMVRGDTLEIDVIPEGDIGTVASMRMTARRAATDEQLFALALGSGITATDDGWAIEVPPSATQAAVPGLYDYDIELTIGEKVYTPLFGTLRIYPDQSRTGV